MNVVCGGQAVGAMHTFVNSSQMVAYFVASTSLADASQTCFGDSSYHFNWYQVVTSSSVPAPRSASLPFIDPLSGGNFVANGAWSDNFPWYYDEVAPAGSCPATYLDSGGIPFIVDTCSGYKNYLQVSSTSVTQNTKTLAFSDVPAGANLSLQFQTYLVGVKPNHSFAGFTNAGFSWAWSNNGAPCAATGPCNVQFLTQPPSSALGTTLMSQQFPPDQLQGGLPLPSGLDQYTAPPSAPGVQQFVPEPASFGLAGIALAAGWFLRRRVSA